MYLAFSHTHVPCPHAHTSPSFLLSLWWFACDWIEACWDTVRREVESWNKQCEHQWYFNFHVSWLCKPTAVEFQHNLEPSPTLIFLTLQPVVIGPPRPSPAAAAGIFLIALPLLSFTLFNSCWQLQAPNAKLLCLSHLSPDAHSCSTAGRAGPLTPEGSRLERLTRLTGSFSPS